MDARLEGLVVLPSMCSFVLDEEGFGTVMGRVAFVLNPPVLDGDSEDMKLGVPKGDTSGAISLSSLASSLVEGDESSPSLPPNPLLLLLPWFHFFWCDPGGPLAPFAKEVMFKSKPLLMLVCLVMSDLPRLILVHKGVHGYARVHSYEIEKKH